MPSKGRKFITEFLLPSLNKEIFGPRLMWLDIENKVFQIQWNHKSASDWTTSDAAVFAAWDKRKGHYKPDDKEYYPKSKQRFRAVLYKFIKLKHITELCSEEKYTKIYCVGDGKNISGTHITDAKSEKENDGSENSQKVKQNPEDLVIDWNSILNATLYTEPQESCLVAYHNPEMTKEYFVKREQVVTDCTDELIPETLHYENLQNNVPSVNSSAVIKKNFTARETSNIIKESEDVKSLYVEFHYISKESEVVKSLHVEFHYEPEKSIYKKDNNLKRPITIENDNFHDYLRTVTDPLRQVEYPDHEFHDMDEDLSFDLPLPCI